MSKDFAKDIKVNPTDALALAPNDAAEVNLQNGGKRMLTYKLKTTRPQSVKPTKAFGVIPSNGKEKFTVNFKPTTGEKPFMESDRVTVLVGVLPDANTKPEQFWKNPSAAADAHRIVLKLQKAGEKPKKKEVSEKEEETKSEAETTESGSEATESGSEA